VVAVLFVVEDFIDGERVGEVVKIDSSDGDLFTAWILRLFYAMFSYVRVVGSVTFSALDDTGASRVFRVKSDYGDFIANIFNTYGCPGGVRVRYGSGSAPPSRSDYRLVSEILVDGNPSLFIDEGRGFVMVQSDVVFSSAVTVCEVGLSLYGVVAGSRTCGEFLLDRTVFSPCRVIPAGTPYTVRYRVQL
jgi:hypothetical protein